MTRASVRTPAAIPSEPTRRRSSQSSASVPAMFESEIASGIPQTPTR